MKRNYWLIISVLAVLLLGYGLFIHQPKKNVSVGSYQAQALVMDESPFLTGDIDHLIRTSHFKGVALVVKNDQVVYKQAFGYANFARLEKNSLKIAYPIASLQKFMTGALIAQLVGEGKITYDQTVESFYPQLPTGKDIQIRDLLNHTSGIRMAEENPGKLLGTEEDQLNYVLTTLQATDDHSFNYTNANYTLLSGIVSQVTGQRYEDVLTQRIIEPLGLHATYSWEQRPQKMVFPRAYRYAEGKNYQDDQFFANKDLFSSLLGAGNLFMSITDMLHVQRGLTNGELLTPQEYHDLTQIEDAGYAGGISHENGIKSIHGSLGGYDTYVYGDENNKNLVILFANQPGEEGNGIIAETIYEMLKI